MLVTGVQTCALPISSRPGERDDLDEREDGRGGDRVEEAANEPPADFARQVIERVQRQLDVCRLRELVRALNRPS